VRPALFLAWGLAATGFAAETPTVTATASKAEVTVGESFTVDLQATGPAGTTFTFPAEVAEESVDLRTAAPAGTPAPSGQHRYEAAVFAIGQVQVPRIPVRYRLADGTEGEAATEPLALKVVSLLPKDKDDQKLADIKGPVEVKVGRAFWIGLGALALVLGAFAFWLWKRKKVVPTARETVREVAPDEEVLQALAALQASGRLARGEYRAFYIELASIAKRYLERRTGAPIVEMTSAEMLAHLRASPHASLLASPMRELAGAADQVKFARGAGLHDEAERHLAAVHALVMALEAQLRPAVPEGGKAA
jgi:hypothetical protein